MNTKKGFTSTAIVVVAVVALLALAGYFVGGQKDFFQKPEGKINSFEECAAAGYPIMESYPEQCRTPDGRVFVRDITLQGAKFGILVTLAIGERIQFSDGLTATLLEVNDSRCKPGVVCVWAGELSPLFRATGGTVGTAQREVRLGTVTAKSASLNGYTLTLQDAATDAATITVTTRESPTPIACTEEAKQCPDGSYVSRTGKDCEFAKCPAIHPPSAMECKKNSDCPSPRYICEETEGMGVACPGTDPSCVPTHTLIKGECKVREGSRCSVDSDCAAGNLCHKNICASPIGRQCSGPSDRSCPSDYECVQGCGPPVVRYPDDTPPSYFCQLKGYTRICPICLAGDTLIDTPLGRRAVKDLRAGMPIVTVDGKGHRVAGVVLKTSKVAVSPTHQMVHLILADGREVFASPGHGTSDKRTVGDLMPGGSYDGAFVISAERVPYGEGATYDVLPSGETGFYFANGILLGSTLHLKR